MDLKTLGIKHTLRDGGGPLLSNNTQESLNNSPDQLEEALPGILCLYRMFEMSNVLFSAGRMFRYLLCNRIDNRERQKDRQMSMAKGLQT